MTQLDNKTVKRLLIGAISLLFLSILSASQMWDFLLWAVTGTLVSVFVFAPVNNYLVTREFKIAETTGFILGVGVLIYLYMFVYTSIDEMLIFIFEWLVAYNLIAIMFDFVEDYLP